MSIGEQIRSARKAAGLTQKALGDRCQMPDSQIRQYELGMVKPKLEQLQRIANALDIDVSLLLDVDVIRKEMDDAIHNIYVSECNVRQLAIKHLVDILNQLNIDGINDLVKYAYSLLNDDAYKTIIATRQKTE